jgi:hypothetical protein
MTTPSIFLNLISSMISSRNCTWMVNMLQSRRSLELIGQMTYLEKFSRLDISCAVHHGERFVFNPRLQHGKALP